MSTPLRVLVVEDSEDDALLITGELRRGGFDPFWERVETREAMAEALDRGPWDLILSDFRMPSFSAADALALYRQRGIETPFILVSGTVGEEQAVASLKAGAHDFFLKSRLARLCPAVERELREAENRRARHRAEEERALLINGVTDYAILMLDPSGHVANWNAGAERISGYRADEIIGQHFSRFHIPEDIARGKAASELEAAARLGRVEDEGWRVRKDGSRFWADVIITALRDESGRLRAFAKVTRDVTERRQGALRIQHLNRVYAVLSEVNQAIVRVREPRALFAEACRIAVESGDFRMAWVGVADLKTNGVRPIAHAGVVAGYLDDPQLHEARALGPTATVLREGRREVSNDIEHDPKMASLRGPALERGYRALAALPLKVHGQSVAVLSLYATEPGSFDAEELRLLDEMATDLSFAMEMARLEMVRLRLATAIDQSPVSVVITDVDGRIEYVNPAFTRITGYSAEDALGANPRMLKSGKQGPELYQALWATINAGKSWSGEIVNRRKDGSLYTQDLTIAPVRSPTGTETYFVAIGQDVTERKRAEETLRENARVLIESQRVARLGSYRTDLVSGTWTSSTILDEIFGIDDPAFRRDVAGWLSIVHPDLREELARYFAEEVVGKRNAFDRVYRIIRLNDREERWVHGLGRLVLDGDGRPVEMFGTIQDITQRQRAEAERAQVEGMLFQAQKIEAIGQLAGGVAHDFNNILGVITGYGELALAQLGSEHPARARVDQILKAADRAAGLTRQLLAFSRKQLLKPQNVDLNETIADIHKMLDRLIGEDIQVVIRPAPGLGTVRVDPGQMVQIILNLAVNARDAMPKGGSLTLETANVDFDESYASTHPPVGPGRHVMLAVSDTGIGMDAETQRRIFEPFFTTKPAGEGTGLGLATVYGIVKQSGGYIWVYSEPSRGTTFKVYLPRVDEPVAAARLFVAAPAAGAGHETILLVEDNEALRDVIRETLESNGYTVLPAPNGEEALALTRAEALPIHLLLTDVVMPRLGGGDLVKLLAVSRPEIRVLYMSGYTDGAVSQQGVLGEGFALLEKPFTGGRLLEAVRRALSGAVAGEEGGYSQTMDIK